MPPKKRTYGSRSKGERHRTPTRPLRPAFARAIAPSESDTDYESQSPGQSQSSEALQSEAAAAASEEGEAQPEPEAEPEDEPEPEPEAAPQSDDELSSGSEPAYEQPEQPSSESDDEPSSSSQHDPEHDQQRPSKRRRRHSGVAPGAAFRARPPHAGTPTLPQVLSTATAPTSRAGPSRYPMSTSFSQSPTRAGAAADGHDPNGKGKGRASTPDGVAVKPEPISPLRGGWAGHYAQQQAYMGPALDILGAAAGADAQALPSTDLLNAVHAHAATFYSTHALLSNPDRRKRARQWDGQKRVELAADGALEGDNFVSRLDNWDDSGGKGADAGPRWRRHNTRRTSTPAAGARVNGASVSSDVESAVRPYKRVDMRLSMEGTALLAMAVLVEEQIEQELRMAGYVPRVRGVSEANGAAHEEEDGDVDEEDKNDDDDDDDEDKEDDDEDKEDGDDDDDDDDKEDRIEDDESKHDE